MYKNAKQPVANALAKRFNGLWTAAYHRFYIDDIYQFIKETTHHDATLFKGVGCYEGREKTLLYSVIHSEATRQLIPLIRSADPHAFIKIVKTEELDGRFHDITHD